MDSLKNNILTTLRSIPAPDGRGDLMSSGLVSDIIIQNGKVTFALNVAPHYLKSMQELRSLVEKSVKQINGVEHLTIALTSEIAPGISAAPIKPASPPTITNQFETLAQTKHIIAIASGKGGVGKSTTAFNLALAFQHMGLKTAILDADIYGPSMPRLFGLKDKPQAQANNSKRFEPLKGFGITVMSIGFLVDEGSAMIWRGPMIISAITQLLRDVAWGENDIMLIDMPPGTGDAQLTIAQKIPLSGAVIVSTPQDLALIDARRGIAMFSRLNVPILGIIENMSYFTCPNCQERHMIFGHGGARQEAEKSNVDFLGEIPLDIDIRRRADQATPLLIEAPNAPQTQPYKDIATKIWKQLVI